MEHNLNGGTYYKELLAPALERAAKSHRTSQPETLGPEFFGSSFSKRVISKGDKPDFKFGRWKMGPATASPVAGPVEIEKADFLIVSTGLNGKNPSETGYYNKPAAYDGESGDPKMPKDIDMGVQELVMTAIRFAVCAHVSAAQSAAGYRYEKECATQWQHAAEKMCYDIGDDDSLKGSFVIDTCADSRESLLTRRDLGSPKDAWHFILENATCKTVLFHELDKLKYLSWMFLSEEQQDGWISLMSRGCGADSLPKSLGTIIPLGIPFCTVFLEGHTIGIEAYTAPDSATAEEEQHNDDAPAELFVVGKTDTYECVDADKNGVQSWRKCNVISISPKEAVVDILQPVRAPPPRPGALRVEPSSPTELPVPTEVIETPPTSPAEENLADDQRLGGPPTEELTWCFKVKVDPKRLRVVPSAATGGPVGSPQAAAQARRQVGLRHRLRVVRGPASLFPNLKAVALRQLLQVVTSISLRIPTLRITLNRSKNPCFAVGSC